MGLVAAVISVVSFIGLVDRLVVFRSSTLAVVSVVLLVVELCVVAVFRALEVVLSFAATVAAFVGETGLSDDFKVLELSDVSFDDFSCFKAVFNLSLDSM